MIRAVGLLVFFLLRITGVGASLTAPYSLPSIGSTKEPEVNENEYRRFCTDNVPRINLSWPEDDIVDALVAASSGPGFFYLVGHSIPQQVLDAAFEATEAFYAQSLAEKREISAMNYGGGKISGRDVVIKGYVEPSSEGGYKKDGASDMRPDSENATLQKNTRESLCFRYPELTTHMDGRVKDSILPSYVNGNYANFVAELAAAHHLPIRGNSTSTPPEAEIVKDFRDFVGTDRVREVEEAARRFFLPNQWPSKQRLPAFKPAVEDIFAEFARIAERLFKLYARSVARLIDAEDSGGSTEGGSRPWDPLLRHDKPMWTGNFVHYPATINTTSDSVKERQNFGIADHSDWEAFTLLYPRYSDESEGNPHVDPTTKVAHTGLEAYLDPNGIHGGGWTPVPHVPGAIIVNQGEMLSRMSGGRFKAPVHRVQAQNSYERYSIISFWAPDYDTFLPDPVLGHVMTGEYYLTRNNFLG